MFYAPNFFGNPDNYQHANPLVTPPDIVPEWYLLPFYAMLRSIPHKLIGVLVLVGALVDPGLHSLARHLAGALLPLPSADEAVLLGLRGGLRGARLLRRAERRMRRRFGIPLVWVARLGTLYYFAYLLAAHADRGPDRNAQEASRLHRQSVLGDTAAAPAE